MTTAIKLSDDEVRDLAVAILGFQDDAEDETVERGLYIYHGVEMEDFKSIVEALLPLIDVGTSPLTGKRYKGFSKDGFFIVKQEV